MNGPASVVTMRGLTPLEMVEVATSPLYGATWNGRIAYGIYAVLTFPNMRAATAWAHAGEISDRVTADSHSDGTGVRLSDPVIVTFRFA